MEQLPRAQTDVEGSTSGDPWVSRVQYLNRRLLFSQTQKKDTRGNLVGFRTLSDVPKNARTRCVDTLSASITESARSGKLFRLPPPFDYNTAGEKAHTGGGSAAAHALTIPNSGCSIVHEFRFLVEGNWVDCARKLERSNCKRVKPNAISRFRRDGDLQR